MESLLWIEKYRPQNWDEIVGNQSNVELFKGFIKQKTIPHLLLIGPPGTLKTSMILLVAKEILGESYNDYLLELNVSDILSTTLTVMKKSLDKMAADTRRYTRTEKYLSRVYIDVQNNLKAHGITRTPNKKDILLGAIRLFASEQILGDAPFKILILRDADLLTRSMQHGLRRVIEKYSNTCRFVFIANTLAGIISPIRSRGTIISFKKLTLSDFERFFNRVTSTEGITLQKGALNALHWLSNGNLKKAITYLQVASLKSKVISEDLLYSIHEQDLQFKMKKLFEQVLSKKFATTMKDVRKLLTIEGYSSSQIFDAFNEMILNSSFSRELKIKLLNILTEREVDLVKGKYSDIHIMNLLISSAYEYTQFLNSQAK